ncbi:MAG: cardiolipin synthase [Bacteroidales bacterium]
MLFTFSNYWLTVTLEILYLVTSIAGVIVVIAGNRNPVKTLAWILLFFLLPFIGIIFYVFFGMDYTRQRLISRKKKRKVVARYSYPHEKKSLKDLPESYRRLSSYLNHQGQFPLFSNNDIEVFESGEAKFERLFADIERAKKYIHIEYYIIEADEIGNKLKELLIQKAHEGVEIRLIIDDVGCWKIPKSFFEEMRQAGIQTAIFLEVRFHRLTSRINFRNHRKIVVIDGHVGYTGGMNIADRYVKGLSWGTWKDLHFRIEGNGIEALESAFLIDWYFVKRELLPLKNYIPEGRDLVKGNINMQIVTGGPFGEWREILDAYLKLIHTAKNYVYLQTPYFLPGESLLSALQAAALSGVDVRLMLPEKSDTTMAQLATHSYLKSVMKAGVKVYLYQPGFLHSKMLVADDYIASIGSTNLDFRSFEHNFEINAFVYDTSFAVKMREIFLRDQNDSLKVNLSKWMKRPLRERFTESVVRLFSPLL